MILSGATIRALGIITPHRPRTRLYGMSYGVSGAGYDIRVKRGVRLKEGRTALAISIEHFAMPKNVMAIVHDKSTWARLGVQVQNTVIEPGWVGYLTLEISYAPLIHAVEEPWIRDGSPIAQVIFHFIDAETEGYAGKYQDAGLEPQPAILEAE